jgi:hypothetical protein
MLQHRPFRVAGRILMRSGLNIYSPRQVLLVHCVAVLLLVMAAADIALPQDCCRGAEEDLPSCGELATISNSGPSHSPTAATSISDYSQPDGGSSSSPCEDDCFCCAHGLIGVAVMSAVNLDLHSPVIALRDDPLPSPHPQGTFHPPRFA